MPYCSCSCKNNVVIFQRDSVVVHPISHEAVISKAQIMSGCHRALFTLITASSLAVTQSAINTPNVGNKNTMVSLEDFHRMYLSRNGLVAKWYLKRETVSLQNAVKTGATDADKEVRRVEDSCFGCCTLILPSLMMRRISTKFRSCNSKHIQQRRLLHLMGI